MTTETNPASLLPHEKGSWLEDAYPAALPSIRDAYAAGLAAWKADKRATNPEDVGTDQHWAWELGFFGLPLRSGAR